MTSLSLTPTCMRWSRNCTRQFPGLSNSDIARRLQRLAGIQSQKYYMEILTDFPYDLTLITIAETSHVQDVLSARGTIEGHYRVPWPSGTLRPRR